MVLLGVIFISLDCVSIVSVALPSIQRDLAAEDPDL